MGRPFRRRTVLRYSGTSVLALLAGCGRPDRKPWRELTARDIQVEKIEDDWLVTFELVKLAQGPDDVEVFHDVRVHAYDRNRSEVCTKKLGTIAESYPGGNGLPVEMECTAPPTMLTYSAAESPCDEDVVTTITISVYDEEQGWSYDRYSRDCGEGLPPKPRGQSDDG